MPAQKRGAGEVAEKYGLTAREKDFADEYLISLNAQNSYKNHYGTERGMTDATAKARARDVLARPRVKKYIDDRRAEKHSENVATREEVLSFLTDVMRGKINDQVLYSTGNGQQQSKTDLRVSTSVRRQAATDLAKHYGLYTQQLKVELESQVKFVDDIGVGNKDDGDQEAK